MLKLRRATVIDASPPSGAATGEFDPTTFRSVFAALGRVDLGRTLTDYTVNPNQADVDRQNLAMDILRVLWNVTGAGTYAAGARGIADADGETADHDGPVSRLTSP